MAHANRSEAPRDRQPRWRSDFPVRWDEDHYLTRRELAKFLTLGSALLALANGALAFLARRLGSPVAPSVRVARASALGPGQSVLFRYPTDEDPCILVRCRDGTLRAYSQVCTHLACAVVHRPEDDLLWCPCHRGAFACVDGRPTQGPPVRRLPRIRLEVRGDEVYAVGVEE